jgi:hypothetical protein
MCAAIERFSMTNLRVKHVTYFFQFRAHLSARISEAVPNSPARAATFVVRIAAVAFSPSP